MMRSTPLSSVLDSTDRIPEVSTTRHRDYILTDYEPACSPQGRLHSSSVLRHALRSQGLLEKLWPALMELQTFLGPDETVWGYKRDALGRLGLELYFYNFTRNAPSNPKRVTDLTARLAPHLAIQSRVDEQIPYFMCSLDLDLEAVAATTPHHFRIYLAGERLRDGYDGISYLAVDDELRLENYYTFYRRADQLGEVRQRLAASIRSGNEGSCGALMPAHLCACYTLCYATKPLHDALYFSRLSTAALGQALREHFPDAVPGLFEAHADDFAHLRWDLGYDFRLPTPDATQARVEKVGLYGVL